MTPDDFGTFTVQYRLDSITGLELRRGYETKARSVIAFKILALVDSLKEGQFLLLKPSSYQLFPPITDDDHARGSLSVPYRVIEPTPWREKRHSETVEPR